MMRGSVVPVKSPKSGFSRNVVPVALYSVFAGPVDIAALFLGWMLLLPGTHDRGGLVQVGGGVESDEEDPAPRG